ncbi:uncharacterized protein I303_102520 [Kwoniella dejecticola CBS 10117]|uniref:Uncharacterized protein n=1 Tax=Kwoniella dejecticola CBS 10117 TaxID=1296121 RepID=A0AAJ8KM18_9TREE
MTTTTPSRYPSHLSHSNDPTQTGVSASGPSRPTRGYPTPSIDSSIGSPPSTSSSSVPLHEYSSLADLLQQAGYKDVRVFTPEAEKLKNQLRSRNRGIKKTFDEVGEDEVDSLYDTYGFIRSPPSNTMPMPMPLGMAMDRTFSEESSERMMKHQHITEFEPALPMKSSSSILRSLNIQQQPALSGSTKEEGSSNSWWNGWTGIASAATSTTRPKLVSSDSSTTANSSYETSTEVGLGLAKNGEGVRPRARKVKSTVELGGVSARTRTGTGPRTGTRRAGTDSPPQEERPPLPTQRITSNPNPASNARAQASGYTAINANAYTNTNTNHVDVFNVNNTIQSPPPPVNIDEGEYGYSPLPEDYEAQCTEDEAFYQMGMNDHTSLYSLGSSATSNSNPVSIANSLRERDASSIFSKSFEGDETVSTITHPQMQTQEREGSEDRAVREINEFTEYQNQYQVQDELDIDMEMIDQINEAGRRILKSTINVDSLDFDADSPESQISDLPEEEDYESNICVPDIPLPTIPQVQMSAAIVDEEQPKKKTLKYGDRATKLRIAHSTPALRQTAIASASSTAEPLPEGWLGTIRSALLGTPRSIDSTSTQAQAQIHAQVQAQSVLSQPRGPIKISSAKPASPITITNTPVICDSISNDAGDLPPIPKTKTKTRVIHQSKSIGLLKYRPSLAKLREAVLGTGAGMPEYGALSGGGGGDEDGLVLSPRIDWDEQGKHAGWSPYKSRHSGQRGESGGEGEGEIDYSKSFFYKPFTPPSKRSSHATVDAKASADVAWGSTPPASSSTSASTSTSTSRESTSISNNLGKKRSIKSLKAALLLPVAPKQETIPPVPPVPTIPEYLSHLATPRKSKSPTPILAIQSPGSFAPRELVLEGEEWDAREGNNDWGRGRGRRPGAVAGAGAARGGNGNGSVRRRKSKKVMRD